MSDKFTFFWNGPFSQWHSSPFEIDGIKYNCAEQWMMAEKARMFKDDESLKKIMALSSPKEQKAIGRKVVGFNPDEWANVCKHVVYVGNIAKFKQNENLRKVLFGTEGTSLVEASPYDKIWGIGLDESDPRVYDKEQWLGTNWLGEVLDRVRETLLKEYSV